jgi:VirE N-terminal domain
MIPTTVMEESPLNVVWPISQDKSFTYPDGYLWTQGPSSYQKYIFSGNLQSVQDRVCSNAGFQYLPQFALYPKKANVNDFRIVNLLEVIGIMKGDELKYKAMQIREAREVGDEARRTELKDSLPYITHSGIFIPRRNSGLTLPGFTYQLDIDKIPNPQEILEKLLADRELIILFATIGASGNGIKALLFLKELMFLREAWTHEQYSKAYHQVTDILETYFKNEYGVKIDTQMKAISQPFYLFHSPDLHVHKNFKGWV